MKLMQPVTPSALQTFVTCTPANAWTLTKPDNELVPTY
jgi:hypothetical protein